MTCYLAQTKAHCTRNMSPPRRRTRISYGTQFRPEINPGRILAGMSFSEPEDCASVHLSSRFVDLNLIGLTADKSHKNFCSASAVSLGRSSSTQCPVSFSTTTVTLEATN